MFRPQANQFREWIITLNSVNRKERAKAEALLWEHLAMGVCRFMPTRRTLAPGFDPFEPAAKILTVIKTHYDPTARNDKGKLTSPWSYACRVWERCHLDYQLQKKEISTEELSNDLSVEFNDPYAPSAHDIEAWIHHFADSPGMVEKCMKAYESGGVHDPEVLGVLRKVLEAMQSGDEPPAVDPVDSYPMEEEYDPFGFIR